MLRILRKNVHSPLFLIIIILIAVVFVFWGVGTNMGTHGGKIASVDGREISGPVFARTYNQLLESYKQQFGGQIPEKLLNTPAIKQQAIRQLIQRELVRKGAAELGITVSDPEVRRAIAAIPAFQKEGRFDLETYRAVLTQNKMAETSFEESMRGDLLQSRVMAAISGFAEVSDPEVDLWLGFAGLELRLSYAVFAQDDFASQVQQDDKILADWYAGKKELYRPDPQSRFTYLFFPFDAHTSEVQVSEEELRAYYTEQSQNWHTPEQRQVRHILFKVEQNADEAVRKAKKEVARKVLAQVRADNFAKLADAHTEDPAGKGKGGNLGLIKRGQMVPEFEEAAFALKSGANSQIVESPFGFHIIKVEKIVPEKTPTFEEKKEEISRILGLQKARALAFKKASEAYEGIMRAGSLARYGESGHKLESTELIAQKDVPQELAVLRDPAIARAAFALTKGALSSITEGAAGYAILFAEEVKQPEPPPLDQIREQLVKDFTKEKSAELAKKAAEDALIALEKNQEWPSSIQAKTTDFIGRVSPDSSVSPRMVQDAFSRLGKSKTPTAPVVDGEKLLVYRIETLRQGKDDAAPVLRDALAIQILQDKRSRLFNDWLNRISRNSKIWINPEILK